MTLRRPLTLINGLLRLLPTGDRLPGADIGARVHRTTAQAIANATGSAIIFNSTRYDTSALWSGSNPTRLTCSVAGRYLIGGSIEFAVGSAGIRQISIRLNGTTPIAPQNSSHPANRLVVATVYSLAVGDYAELLVYHENGSSLDILSSSAFSPEFYMQLLP